MNARVERLRAELEEPLLVTAPVNVLWLTGLASSNAALLVEPGRLRLFTDFRYVEAARALDGVEVVETARALAGDLAGRLTGRVAVEAERISHADWVALGSGGLELVDRPGLVTRLRAVKAADELDAIRRAAAVTDRAYERLAAERFAGRTERELAWRMEVFLREEGGEGLSFEPVVASGPTGALPHASPGDREIRPGDTVVVDSGTRVDGYCSDCTRTFAVGPLPDRLREAYRVCLDAQESALAAVRPEISGRDLDAVARDRIDATEFRGLFGHGLGHGVGLEVHELPVTRPESQDVLAPGHVLTIEPGIYLPGEGGIRIEDLVVVTEDGCEVLSGFTKDLLDVA